MDVVRERVQHAVEAVLDRKGTEVDVLYVAALTSIADYFIICSGTTERQTQAIADAVEERLRTSDQVKPIFIEGQNPGRWILVDYGDFIVHVFTEECRRFYALERLWGDAPNLIGEFSGEPSVAQGNERP
ncbi:MAG: ribosome silencing factor [Acidobacteriota bacterium]